MEVYQAKEVNNSVPVNIGGFYGRSSLVTRPTVTVLEPVSQCDGESQISNKVKGQSRLKGHQSTGTDISLQGHYGLMNILSEQLVKILNFKVKWQLSATYKKR